MDFYRPHPLPRCCRCARILWSDALVDVAQEFGVTFDAIIPEVSSHNADEVLQALARAAAESAGWTIEQRTALTRALQEREALASTALGRGVAIPHAVMDWVQRPVTVAAFAPAPIHFSATDNMPVHTFVMLASSRNKRYQHVENMRRLTRMLRVIASWCS